MEIKTNVVYLSESPVEVTLLKDDTTLQVKEKIGDLLNIPAQDLKLICKGKIMKDDKVAGDILDNDDTIHAIRNKTKADSANPGNLQSADTPSQPEESAVGGAQAGGNSSNTIEVSEETKTEFMETCLDMMEGGIADIAKLENPAMKNTAKLEKLAHDPQAWNEAQGIFSDPEKLLQMYETDPKTQSEINQNPQIKAMLENPDMWKNMCQMVSTMTQNPQMLSAFQGFIQNQFLGGQSSSVGATSEAGGAGANPALDFMKTFLPADLITDQASDPSLPPEEKYKDQLQQMADKGLTNKDLNIEMLDATDGDVELAIEKVQTILGQAE